MPKVENIKTHLRSREIDDILVLLKTAHDDAHKMKTEDRQFLVETESILTSRNTHCYVLRKKYLALEEAVEGLPVNHNDPRFESKPFKKVRTEISKLEEEIKHLNKDFQTYYSTFLVTCLEKLQDDCKLMKAGTKDKGVLNPKHFKVRINIMNDNLNELKKILKRYDGLEPFPRFWSDFSKIHDEVKTIAKIFHPNLVETHAENYLGFRVPDSDSNTDYGSDSSSIEK